MVRCQENAPFFLSMPLTVGMDTIPQPKEDQMLLGSLIITASHGTITSDDSIMTHPAGIYRQII